MSGRQTLLQRLGRALSAGTLIAASAVGVAAFLMPFFAPPAQRGPAAALAHAQDAPMLFLVLVVLALAAVLVDMTLEGLPVQAVAVLGVLAAMAAVLRLVPGPGGFSALFLIPILSGYVYGPRFGFLVGVFGMAVSALLTGGVGPWLPFQMFATGWVGGLAGLWGRLVALVRRPSLSPGRGERLALALWGGWLGLFYGMVMNLWFWPFVFQPQQAALYWQPGLSWQETVARYAAFYLATSLWWDLGRAAGNTVLIFVAGRPTLRALRRFHNRMRWQVFDDGP